LCINPLSHRLPHHLINETLYRCLLSTIDSLLFPIRPCLPMRILPRCLPLRYFSKSITHTSPRRTGPDSLALCLTSFLSSFVAASATRGRQTQEHVYSFRGGRVVGASRA
jgi:hypothetical protein